jgi:phage baseplate assembly protein W
MSTEKNLVSRIKIPSSREVKFITSRTYRGLSTVAESGEFALYDIGLIKQDIINHFHIRRGEKLENPSFGTIIWDLLYEPLTEEVKDLILEDVAEIINYDPRVSSEQILVSEYESGIQIECDLVYLPYNISENLRFTFDQRNGIL